MKRRKVLCVILLVVLVTTSNVYAQEPVTEEESVKVTGKGSYYDVCLDLQKSGSHWKVGKEYGEKILQTIPDYQSIVDSYLAEIASSEDLYKLFINRVNDIKPQVNKEYRDEIEGMASAMSGGTVDVRGDGKLSLGEMYMLNLFPDVARGTQCCALAVYGNRSETRSTMAARVLDWTVGSKNQLTKIQAIMTIRNGNKSICTIGYLGYMGIISGFNDDRVFAAILDSKTGKEYSSESKRSYPFDIRYALENTRTLTEVAHYMECVTREYAVGHLIFLADPSTAGVVENNVSGTKWNRELRSGDSTLNEGITWGISDSVGTVNSFILKGNLDNHSSALINTTRWKSMKEQLLSKGSRVTFDGLKQVITYNTSDTDIGKQEEGSLYNNRTQQIILFEPKTFNLKVFFKPSTGETVLSPSFETVKVEF